MKPLTYLELRQLDTELQHFKVTKVYGDKSYRFVDRDAWLKSKGALNKWGAVILPKDPQAKTPYEIFEAQYSQWVDWDRKNKVKSNALFEGIAQNEKGLSEPAKQVAEEDLLKEALEHF